MALADLELLDYWLQQPHFARWILEDSTIEEELSTAREAIEGWDPTAVLIVELDGRAVGWCQVYRWWDYPDEAANYDARQGEIGFDYGIGEPDAVGNGVGSGMIAALVAYVRAEHPGASMLVGPSAANAASCRVLAKNGFELVDTRDIPGEDNANPIALYRLI